MSDPHTNAELSTQMASWFACILGYPGGGDNRLRDNVKLLWWKWEKVDLIINRKNVRLARPIHIQSHLNLNELLS